MVEEALENGVDPNKPDKNGFYPVFAARNAKQEDAMMALLNCENIDLNVQNSNGNTLLHLAALNEQCEFITFLLSKGAKKDIKNNNGLTALNLAAGKHEAANLLKV